MPTIKTRWFANTMAGAPALSGSVGAMLAVLDAALVNGFNLLTLDSLAVASNVATANKAGHGYVVNQVVQIAGASPAGLNGEWRVTEVTANTFKFNATGIADQTATGTITAKTVGAGWEKQFAGTNTAVYRSGDVLSTRCAIKVDDTVGQYSSVRGAESFTDISTEVNGFSTQYFKKSNATDANARPWVVVADAKTFYLGVDWNSGGAYDFYSFGDFASAAAGDGYCCRLQGLSASNPGTFGQYSTMSNGGIEDGGYYHYSVAARSYSQTIGGVPLRQGSLVSISFSAITNYNWCLSGNHGQQASQNQLPFATPSLVDSGYHFVPVFLFEAPAAGRTLRGTARGLLHVMEAIPQASGYAILSGVENVNGALVMMIRSAGVGLVSNVPSFTYPQTALGFSLGDW